MLTRKQLTEQQARTLMEQGEPDSSVTNDGECVAVVLTQSWCPQSVSMNVWLNSMKKKGEPSEFDLTIYELNYDKLSFFDEFRTFKESYFKNEEIPYIRYYRKGQLVDESNYVPSRLFLRNSQGSEAAQKVK